MESVKDFIGNTVRIGDEVIYVPYERGSFTVSKVTKINPKSITTAYGKGITRFIKVIREVENE